MIRFAKTKNQKPKDFLSDVGIRLETFLALIVKVEQYIKAEQIEHPLKRRGKHSTLALADMLLLTFLYFRHYSTFAKLGQDFGISESYACKIYHRMQETNGWVWGNIVCGGDTWYYH